MLMEKPPQSFRQRPTAIGGLGGSGTRVFAKLLQVAGIHIGDCLNGACDNLWFTILFKRLQWAQQGNGQIPDPLDVARSIRLFRRAMTVGLVGEMEPADRALLVRLRADLPPKGDWQCGARQPQADNLMQSTPPPADVARRWGWKEPNTHVFLRHLNRDLPTLRYIHIVRDGLDMAFSKNTWQTRHWGHLYGCTPDPTNPWPQQQLRYWSAANRAALSYGDVYMPGRFLVVHYDDFCARPEPHWARIQNFLGVSDALPLPEDLIKISTVGRSKQNDLSHFAQADLLEARNVLSIVKNVGQPD
jgi:hypothetical protein